jgi:hypothetical protein
MTETILILSIIGLTGLVGICIGGVSGLVLSRGQTARAV